MMTSYYNPAIPTPTLSFADWQIGFLNNFSNLSKAFAVNHIPLNANQGAGDHTFVQLLEQKVSQQTNLGEFSIYTKEDESTTDQIFMRYQGNGQEFQFSCYQIYSLVGNNFFTFLPGKVLAYFGTFAQTSTKQNLVLLPPVARNIITSVFCFDGTTGTVKPWVKIVEPTSGIITSLTVNTQTLIGKNLNYLVLANI